MAYPLVLGVVGIKGTRGLHIHLAGEGRIGSRRNKKTFSNVEHHNNNVINHSITLQYLIAKADRGKNQKGSMVNNRPFPNYL